MNLLDRYRGCLAGLAVGDAVGTTCEFRRRGSFEAVTDLVGGGPFGLNPGQWTDDTSMALCLAASLIETGGFSAEDQMKRYCRWRDCGYMSSTGEGFDIGTTVESSLRRYKATGNPVGGSVDPLSAGNGSIMRLAPVATYYFPDEAKAVSYSVESSRTTQAAPVCLEACALLARILVRELSGRQKEDVLFGRSSEAWSHEPQIRDIELGAYRDKTEQEIAGSGFVVESLEAALWCFYGTTSYRDATLKAVNLGDDADTTAAVCGQIAGAFYGISGIPKGWLEKLAMRGQILVLADELFAAVPRA